MNIRYRLLIFVFCLAGGTMAQEHRHPAPEKVNPRDTVAQSAAIMKEEEKHAHPEMKSLTSAFLPMNFDGSGTSWQPEENLMYMYMRHTEKTQMSLTGNIFLRYTNQNFNNDSKRGDSDFNSANWLMGMWRHTLSEKDILSFMGMVSADPLTIGSEGSPLLFQTGETNDDIPLIDHQHPHDLFMGLGAMYTHAFNRDVEVTTTLGYPFEPALGPPAFMHRLSAYSLPDAPLSHHWQDATHISFGVATLGFRIRRVKLEGSVFNGREPDENRYDFDKLRLDSYSFRFQWNPVHTLSVQISTGHLESPEAYHADENVQRSTFSVMHTRSMPRSTFISSSLVVGVNHYNESPRTRSLLLESMLYLRPLAISGRYELVQKDAEELLIRTEPRSVYDIHALTLGLSRHLYRSELFHLRAGIQGTYHFTDNRLDDLYGERPASFSVFLQLSPPFMFPQ